MDFKLRKWSLDDLEALTQYANNFKIAKNITNAFPHPYQESDAKAFIEFCLQHDPTQIFTIDINGKASGGIGLHLQEDVLAKNAELGYWVAEPFWGNGIVTSAIAQIVKYGFETFDINRIYARPYGSNTGSKRVLEKAGFEFEAKFDKVIYKNGEYLDQLYYAIRRPDAAHS